MGERIRCFVFKLFFFTYLMFFFFFFPACVYRICLVSIKGVRCSGSGVTILSQHVSAGEPTNLRPRQEQPVFLTSFPGLGLCSFGRKMVLDDARKTGSS